LTDKGGKISNSAFTPLLLNNILSGANGCALGFQAEGKNLGFLAIQNDAPKFLDKTGNVGYTLFHTGNSAKVAIQSTAPDDGLWVW